MKTYISFLSALFLVVAMLPQIAFADVAPRPEHEENDDSACSASPLKSETQSWPLVFILMASMGVLSFGMASRLSKKSDH